MKRIVALAGCAALLMGLLTGCAKSGASNCAPIDQGVAICNQGTPLDFSSVKMKPHMHENGGYYAPAKELGQGLGVPVDVSITDTKATVLVNGKPFTPQMAQGDKNIHIHDGVAYVPIKEFVKVANMVSDVDEKKNTINIHK